MNQKLRILLVTFVLLMLSTVVLGATAASAGSPQRTGYNPGTGKISFIGASVANPLIVPEAVAAGLSKEARAQAILNAYAPQFGASAQNLAFVSEFVTRDGRISRRYQQTYQGLSVVGAQLIVNMTASGGLVSMTGKMSPNLAVGTVPLVSAAQAQQSAIQKAAKEFKVNASTLATASTSLAIYDARLTHTHGEAAVLVYQINVNSLSGAPVKAVALVNAVTGNVSVFYNTIETGNLNGGNLSSLNSTVSAQQITLPRGGGELIVNGGFEATDARSTRASVLDPWTVKNAVGDKIKCDTETKIVAHSGVCAWRFKGGAGESTKLQQVVDLTGFTFASGETLDLSAFFNANKPTTAGKIKVVVAYSDSTVPNKFKGNLGPTSGYEEQVGSVDIASSAVSKIKVMFINKSASGKAYLDDVSLLHAGVPTDGADLATYDTNNTENLPGTFLCDETDMTCTDGADPDADAAHIHANGVYNMYFDWYGRDSLDDAGLQLVSSVHFSVGYCNAGWDPDLLQMLYGDGCPSTIVIDDVIGHELTHGVTQFTSGLIYADQSGAMNESFSDVWGELYDLTDGTAEDTPENRWRIGEEIDFGTPGGGIRDMQDPTIFNNPDRMQSPFYYLGGDDNGGVHTNSGVNNKAAYLMVDGDTFNGHTVVGLGIDKVAQIYYDTQTTKLTESSTYLDLYDALQQSCTDLIGQFGITVEDCDSVTEAVTATEMNLEPGAPTPTAAICPTEGDVASDLFFDDLEVDGSNWTSGADIGPDAWTLANTAAPIVDLADNFSPNQGETSLTYAAMASGVLLPADAYLHFEHTFGFEQGSQNWDGGIIEYSIDGGTSWTQLPSAGFWEEGLDYNGVIFDDPDLPPNPLANATAFVGSSGADVGSTRYTLASLDGETAMFRWTIGTDSIVDADGWHFDNVEIYTCGAPRLQGSNVLPLPAPLPQSQIAPAAGIGKNNTIGLGGSK
ncbi:MAG TPA: M4 family metallopeptidase [Phototrophicaceae bacterium]|jgi:Zn-dependent metalloprotease|nr:M4 family metallopeptidase [Phototrophicaceae bacterium]